MEVVLRKQDVSWRAWLLEGPSREEKRRRRRGGRAATILGWRLSTDLLYSASINR